MSLSQKLTTKISQTQTLTPQMTQSLKILEMSNIELQQELQNMVTDNPLLSLELPEQESDAPASQPEVPEDLSFENTWTGSSKSEFSETDEDSTARIANDKISLREYLTSQINMDFEDQAERFIALSLIDHLDEAGYFIADLELIARTLKVKQEVLESIHKRLLQLDPAGVFSRDLVECLCQQLIDKGLWSDKMNRLIQNLDLFAQGQFEKLKKKCELSDDQLTHYVKLIRELDPKPGLLFAAETNTAIIPDILLRRTPNEQGWHVILNPRTLPKVIIDHQYYSEIVESSNDKKSIKYMKQNYAAATWLEKAMQQRCDTTLKVASEIIKIQHRFFEQGVSALRPLKLSEIAEKLDLHESTISRTVSSKFISTPLGTFELRYFFTTALTSAFGEKDLSAQSVKSRIKILIDGEDKYKPISDDKLVEILKGEGMNIARRTVAKYRDSLGIPSSFYRKGWKNAS